LLELGKGLGERQIASSIDHAGHKASGQFRSLTKFHEFPIDTY
jgi:hypothetical protein